MSGNKTKKITILGGGPAGLAVGYYAKKHGLRFAVYEADRKIGGNAVTLQHGAFRFDSGAHRLHDKDEEVTAELKDLIGKDLNKIFVPSAIFHEGKYIDFPLSPLNLISQLGFATFMKAGIDVIASKIRSNKDSDNFEDFAVSTYGKTISDLFLLGYSEKLWGIPCKRLSLSVSGKRMKGLNLKTFFKEAVLGKKAKTEHLDGSFYYPKKGYGTIVEELANFCGQENIFTHSKITRIFHDFKKIQSVEINHTKKIYVDSIVSTLPLPQFIQLLSPCPDKQILSIAKTLRFRSLIIVTVFLNKNSITDKGSIYFPGKQFPFTRVYEPRNRSPDMSPQGKTSLCAEIPCFLESEFWTMPENDLVKNVYSYFIRLGWIQEKDIVDTTVLRLPVAYPVLEKDVDEKIQKIIVFLKNFSNLEISGRNGKFLYAHVHDMMRFGKDIIDKYRV
jgi:protoporphyrinogen oxidase